MARTSTARRESALQRTPNLDRSGAAELGRAEHRQRRRHGPCGRKARAAGGPAVRHRPGSQRACARGLGDKARRALSPPVLGRRCGGSGFATSHNGLLHARPAFRSPSSLPPGMRATPVMSCAHCRACAGHRLGVPSPCPANTEACAHPGYRLRKLWSQAPQAAQSSSWPPPAIRLQGASALASADRSAGKPRCGVKPLPPPRGGSLALSTVLAQRSAVLAASRVRFAASRP